MVELSDQELDEAEAKVDAVFAETSPPAESDETAKWRVLTLASDRARLLYLRAALGKMDSVELAIAQDRMKYVLKYALAGLRGLPEGHLDTALDEDAYQQATDYVKTYEDYDHVCVAFSSARAGTTSAYRRPNGALHFRFEANTRRIANDVLEGYLSASGSPADPIVDWFRDASSLPTSVKSALDRMVEESGQELRPPLDFEALDELDALLPKPSSHLPESWKFGSADGVQLQKALRRLTVYAVYHTVMVTLGAVKTKTPWVGAAQLVGLHSHEFLCELLASSGMQENDARDLGDLLVYGAAVETPDPALQYFIGLSNDIQAVPWPVVASCDIERNFLSLIARCRRAEFDCQSMAFEATMVRRARAAVDSKSWRCRFNKHIPTQAEAGEVDIVALDPGSNTCLVAELRWTLPPGEVNEVAHRENEVGAKVDQARRKARAVVDAQSAILAEENISSPGEWSVRPLVVFDNYLPVSQPDPTIPVISQRAFLSGLSRYETLSEVIAWFDSGAWLPTEEHFEMVEEEVIVGDLPVIVDGVSPNNSGMTFIVKRDRRS